MVKPTLIKVVEGLLMIALVIFSIEPSFLRSSFLMQPPSLLLVFVRFLKVVHLETMDVSHLLQEIQENLMILEMRKYKKFIILYFISS
jgi:hypothetical protein